MYKKISLVAIMVGVCLGMLAQPVKSIVGGRSIGSAAADGWKNPYITDGLVAMWDGEWNAGGGVHDSAATSWINLAEGGVDTEVVGDISQMWYDDHIVTHDSNYVKIPVSGLSSVTIETVSANLPLGSTIKYWSLQLASGQEVLSGRAYQWGTYQFGIYSPTLYATAAISSNTDKVYWAVVISSDGVKIYARPQGSDLSDSQVIDVSSARYFLSAWSNTQSGRDRPVYASRLYSRALTAAEIAHNYAVDKQRFGLAE